MVAAMLSVTNDEPLGERFSSFTSKFYSHISAPSLVPLPTFLIADESEEADDEEERGEGEFRFL